MTAASATVGWAARRSSTSAGNTFSPPDTIMSSSRPSMNSRPAAVEVAEVAARQQAADVLLAAAAGVAVEAGPVADEDPADLADAELAAVVVEDPHDAARRRPAGRRRGRLRGRPGRRSSPARPRSSRRCCRGSGRTGGAPPSPAWRRAPSRSTRCSAATTCRSGRASRRRGRGCAAASPARRRARRPGARRSRQRAPRGRTAAAGRRSTTCRGRRRGATRPQAWNSGAAITTVSRARIGTVDSSGVSPSAPPPPDAAPRPSVGRSCPT